MPSEMKKQDAFTKLIFFAMLLTTIVAQDEADMVEEQSRLHYTDWLRLVDQKVVQIPPDKRVASIQIPLDIEISSSSENEQCSSENGPYCYSSELLPPTNNSRCSNHGMLYSCLNVTCTNPVQPVDFNQLKKNLSLLYNETNFRGQITFSAPECELKDGTEGPNITITQKPCVFASRQQPVTFNISNLDEGATLIFIIEEPSNGTFLMIEGFGGFGYEGSLLSRTILETIKSEISDGVQHSNWWFRNAPTEPVIRTFRDLSKGEFAVLLNANGWAIFSEGELATIVEFSKSYPLYEVGVQFGSEDFVGQITGIQLYPTIIDSNQIYSMYSGEPLAKYVYLPECGCPSRYFDTFGLAGHSYFPKACEDGSESAFLPYRTRYENYAGKWEAFGKVGWSSDFTDEAEIRINMPQQMLVYAISGSFGYGYKYPSAIEIEIIGSNSKPKAQVFISQNCLEDYALPTTSLPLEVLTEELLYRRKRSTDQSLPPKCYNLNEFMRSPNIGQGTTPNEYDTIGMPYEFIIPLLGVGEESYKLSDSLIGDVKIKLIGHHGIQGSNENWYHLSGLSLYARPNCGGNSFTLLGAPTSMSEYYNFRKPETKAFTCECPPGITGDMCESCGEVAGLFRYQKEPNVCANCDCSDLTQDQNMRCDKYTGQCDCGNNANLEFTGRQCHWYVSNVEPLYGPIAGGTQIAARVGYIDGYGINFNVQMDSTPLYYNISESREELVFSAPEAYIENTTVDLRISALTSLNIGLKVEILAFDYLPNPILKDIRPRTTIIGGGKDLTVTGNFLDSVFVPKMVIYLRQRNVITETFVTRCTLVTGKEMTCPTADLREASQILLGGETADAAQAPVSASKVSSKPHPTEHSLVGESQPTDARLQLHGLRTERASATEEKAGENSLNGKNGVQFTLGVLFDGHNPYKDLEESTDPQLRALSTIYVYDDPVIDTFEQESGKEYLDVMTGELVRMSGQNLDYGVSEIDYVIEVGMSYCNLTALSSNQIVCRLPEEEPEIFEGNTIQVGTRYLPHVKVVVGNLRIDVGYLHYPHNLWEMSEAFRYGMIALIAVVCLAIIFVILFFAVKKNRNKEKNCAEAMELDDSSTRYIKSPGNREGATLWFPGRTLDPNIQANVNRCKIPQERLTVGKQIGKGNFGLVYKGQLILPSGNLKTVAVKTLKDDKEMSFEDMENFLAEGTMMIDFKHENVSSLIGVVSKEGERPMVVLPYMENGDLCSFIRREDLDLVLADILHFGLQIANGMSYLASQRFVHRDLAARNCMVDNSYIVKISDFGMSRDVYATDYYKMDNMNKPLPMKWMAIESLKEGRFSSKSDVWAYGITMWELLTRGSSPYPGVNNYHIKEYISTGKRLDRPACCPPMIYDMMLKCWEETPENRPSFERISNFLGHLLSGKSVPSPGSDEAAGYSYVRDTTRNIPEDYLSVQQDGDSDDYLGPHKISALLDSSLRHNSEAKSKEKISVTPAERTDPNSSGDYYNTQKTVYVYQ